MIVRALEKLLNEQPDIQIVGTAFNAEEALLLTIDQLPDVALLDVRMPLGGGPVAALEIRARELPTKIVALSAFNDPATVDSMNSAGAVAYVPKDAPVEELLSAIRAAAALSQAAGTG
jgi:DNA-binding NarL/FixJ family response regulator